MSNFASIALQLGLCVSRSSSFASVIHVDLDFALVVDLDFAWVVHCWSITAHGLIISVLLFLDWIRLLTNMTNI